MPSLLERLREKKPRHLRKKLLMAVVSVIISLVLLEGLEWWLEVADPPTFIRHPEYGYLMSPSQSVATRGHRYRINAHGLRGKEIVMPKPAGNYRIAFLGDSVTYGGGAVRDEDLFVERVAASLEPLTKPHIEGVNISAPGWGILNMAGFIRTVGLFDSDLLVWVISSADLRRPFTTIDDHRFLEKKPASRLLYSVRVSLIKAREFTRKMNRPPGVVGSPEALEENIRTLREMLAELHERGTPVAVVLVPGIRGYDSRSDVDQFRETAADCAAPFLDTAAAFEGKQLRASYIDDIHLSAQGHAIVAGAIGPFLGEHFLLGRRSPRVLEVPETCRLR
jgi:lysophospholipase L1-like esterase